MRASRDGTDGGGELYWRTKLTSFAALDGNAFESPKPLLIEATRIAFAGWPRFGFRWHSNSMTLAPSAQDIAAIHTPDRLVFEILTDDAIEIFAVCA
jgi:hypothetical protein